MAQENMNSPLHAHHKRAGFGEREMAQGHKKLGGGGNGHFIQHAIKRPGALTAKAKAAGESVAEFAREHEHTPGRTGDEARFYNHVLAPAAGKRKNS